MVSFIFWVLGIFFISTSLRPPQLNPNLQVLNPAVTHFKGGLSGTSEMSNAMWMCEWSLLMSTENKVISPMGVGVVNTLLNKMLPSKSFQNFTFSPRSSSDRLRQAVFQFEYCWLGADWNVRLDHLYRQVPQMCVRHYALELQLLNRRCECTHTL